MWAAWKGSAECVDLLIKAGADLNLKDNGGLTALMKAAGQGSPECVDLLIKAGADLNLKDKAGMTALMKAAGQGSPECVDLLIKAGADLNLKDRCEENTALSLAKSETEKQSWESEEEYEERKAGKPKCAALLEAAGAKE